MCAISHPGRARIDRKSTAECTVYEHEPVVSVNPVFSVRMLLAR